jgi:hypothetical protein
MKSIAGPPHVTDSTNLLRDTQVKVNLLARALLTPVVQELCTCGHGVYSN